MFGVLRLCHEEVVINGFLSLALNLARKWASIAKAIWSEFLAFCHELFFLDSSHGIPVIFDVAKWGVKVLASSLALDFKTVNFWFVVVDFRGKDHGLLLVLQEMVRECRTEKSTIDVNRSEFGNVNLLTSWAVNFESRDLKLVTEAYWQDLLSIA